MSFRLFIYYCALSGGGGAFVGWAIGRTLAPGNVLGDGIKGLWLGLGVALALALVDALVVCSLRQLGAILARVLVALMVGCLGGLLGGLLGRILYERALWDGFVVFGWTITGMLIGISLGVFDLLASIAENQPTQGAVAKILKGLLGGTLGGVLGGMLYLVLQGLWTNLFASKNLTGKELWSPSSYGFVALGMCIGLLIGLTQVILKEAWVKVEQGFRKGREQILAKQEVTIGRGEACDIGLFGDMGVERLHCKIVRQGNQYLLVDVGSAGGTYVNDERVVQPRLLRSGDAIRLGKCLLRFGERQKNKG
jgi:hypothetical protein